MKYTASYPLVTGVELTFRRLLYAAFLLLFFIMLLSVSEAKEEELSFVLFPVIAKQQVDGKITETIRIWTSEKEVHPINLKLLEALTLKYVQLPKQEYQTKQKQRFQDRIKWLFYDDVDVTNVEIGLEDIDPIITTVNHYGHSKVEFVLSKLNGKKQTISIHTKDGESHVFKQNSIKIPSTGVSVIADIDDTLKRSNVLNKKELVRNTFFEKYKTMEGMPSRFAKFKKQGMSFHYVSASPWQLWPSLRPFMDKNYPQGSVNFRSFNPNMIDRSFYNFLWGSSIKYKTQAIEQLVLEYPNQQFILVGDSAECDPEVFGDITNRFPDKIKQIIIQKVSGSDFSIARMKSAFEGINFSKVELVGEEQSAGIHSCKK